MHVCKPLPMGLLLGTVLLSGCLTHYTSPQATTKLTYFRGTLPPPVAPAPQPGHYVLYAMDTVIDPDNPPPLSVVDNGVTLAKGDDYGFVRKADGTVVAVAGNQEISLGSTVADTYFWRIEKPMPARSGNAEKP